MSDINKFSSLSQENGAAEKDKKPPDKSTITIT